MPASRAFDDRTVSLKGGEVALARVAELLASPTRLALLRALRDAPEPLHINALARRVGVDASPVRTHLELLLKEDLVDEVPSTSRLRRFTTRLDDARLTLVGAKRPRRPEDAPDTPPKEVTRLERKLAEYGKRMDTLRDKAARVQDEIEAAWGRAAGARDA